MVESVDRKTVQEMLKSGAQLVEVLPAKQYRSVHLPGAVNIPLTKLDRSAVQALSRDRELIVYCYDYQ